MRPRGRAAGLVAAALTLAVAVGPVAFAQDARNGLQRAQAADAELQRGDPAQAVTLFTDALADKTLPNDRRAQIHGDRALAYARLQNNKAAVEDFNRAVLLYPEHAPLYNNRGNLLLKLGLTSESLKDFDRAILLAPAYPAAYSNRAGAHLRAGETDLAIADFTRAIELQPTLAAAFAGRGRAQFLAGRPHAASRDLTRAVSLDPRLASTYRNRAEARTAIEQYNEAIEDLSRAVAFEPRSTATYVRRGYAYLAAGNAANAIKDFTTALELDPASVPAYIARGIANARLDLHDDALNDLAKAIELDPRATRAYCYRAWVYKLTRQPELGLKDIERAVRIEQGLPDVFWARGEVIEALGQTDAALADYARALEIDPKFAEAKTALARLGKAPVREEVELKAGAFGGWRIVRSGVTLTALNASLPQLRVPLEMLGRGEPKILEWELKNAPYKGLGVLRYHAGKVETATGPEELEHAAIVDLAANAIVGVELQRKGDKLAQWTWDNGRLVVLSADGVTDEFQLGPTQVAQAPPPEAVKKPVNNGWSDANRQRQAQQRSAQQKSKSLFQMIFGF